MENRYFSFFAVAALTILFSIVCALVVLSRRNPYFVEQKLRIGALLLTLTGTAVGCGAVSCYEPGITRNEVSIQLQPSLQNVYKIAPGDTIQGSIRYCNVKKFTYTLTDSMNVITKQDSISANDGAFDNTFEEFKIATDLSLAEGIYTLELIIVDFNDWNQNYRYTFGIRKGIK